LAIHHTCRVRARQRENVRQEKDAAFPSFRGRREASFDSLAGANISSAPRWAGSASGMEDLVHSNSGVRRFYCVGRTHRAQCATWLCVNDIPRSQPDRLLQHASKS
jgi:hypothetical protein